MHKPAQYELAIQLPEKLKPGHSIKTDYTVGIEDYWRRRFQRRRRNWECFEFELGRCFSTLAPEISYDLKLTDYPDPKAITE